MRLLVRALVLLLASAAAHAARLPDWARAVAEQAPPVESAASTGFESRVLLSETTLTVLPDGAFRTRRLLARQSLHPRAQDVGVEGHSFGMNSKIKIAKVWHLPPGEKVERSQIPPLDVSHYWTFATDRKTRVVRVDNVRRGSLVFFEFEAEDREPTLDWAHTFYEAQPITEATLRLELPPRWTVRHGWVRAPGPEPEVVGSTYTWTLHDLVPAPEEPMAPPPFSVAPLLALTILPPGEVPLVLIAQPLPDWRAMGLWYDGLVKGREQPAANVGAAAHAAWPGTGDDPLRGILQSAAYVRDKVRYIDRAVGIGGYQPHAAEQVASELVGDCKDKGTLLRGMLAVHGRRSYPVLVHATAEDTVAETVPSLGAFNHYVVAVELPADLPVPTGVQPAVLDAGDLGKLLIVDTTNESLSPGSVAAGLAGKRALLVAGDRSRIVTLPGMDASAHRIERTLEAEVQSNGAVRWRRVSRHWGAPATECRAEYRRSAEDRKRGLEAWIAQRWPGATVTAYEAEAETADGAFVEAVAWTSPPSGTLDVFPGADEEVPRVPLAKRVNPVVYPYPRTIRYTVTVKGAPVPALKPMEASGEGWSARRTSGVEDGALTASWEVRLEKTRFAPEESTALKGVWSGLRKTSSLALSVPRR